MQHGVVRRCCLFFFLNRSDGVCVCVCVCFFCIRYLHLKVALSECTAGESTSMPKYGSMLELSRQDVGVLLAHYRFCQSCSDSC